MSDFILHHYALSPFSEKIRVMLGYAGLDWQSVIVDEMPPRPKLEALTGGYRKIPVAQVGADVFCDTRAIAREIARLADKPELALENNSEAVRDFVEVVDLEVFLACIIASSGPGLLLKMARNTSVMHTYRFLKDRIAMGRTAKVKPIKPKQAKETVKAHLRRLEGMLSADFLFGATPCIADFSAYHSLWYVRDLAERKTTHAFPKVEAWMDRMAAFGHGNPTPITADDALEQARGNEPRPLSDDGTETLVGSTVNIAPSDYARDPVRGILVSADAQEWVVRRDEADLGTVHVHFPRQGFRIEQV
ncbi:glutathione S-transferase family protein [Marinobacteraceae bacterium S3BR75-40.1]